MPRKRKIVDDEGRVGTGSPTQEDEGDILSEIGAEPDENGHLTIDEDTIRELGAVDAASVRENRRMNDVVGKKRANQTGVPFNTNDPIIIYDILLKVWPANSVDILVKRLSGANVQYTISSKPRSGVDLYEALKALHGQGQPEAEYEVRFVDSGRKEYRGIGRITMPDTRTSQQTQAPMNYPPQGYPPPGYPQGYPSPAPGYPPQQAVPAPQPPSPAPVPSAAPAAAPVVFQAPATGPDMGSVMATFQQMLEMVQRIQQQAQPAAPAPAPAPAWSPPQMPVVMPVPPAPGADMAATMEYFRQLFEMTQKLQPAASVSSERPQPPPVAPAPGMTPPVQSPPGTIFVPGIGFVPLNALMQAMGVAPEQESRSMRRGSPRGYGPLDRDRDRDREREPDRERERDYDPGSRYLRHEAPQQPAPPPLTLQDQFREAVTIVKTAVQAMNDMHNILPGTSQGEREAPPPPSVTRNEEDDSPVRVMEFGGNRLVFDKEDGGLRGWDTGLANIDKFFKFVGEQTDKFRQVAQQQQPQTRLALPPGYVEVGPDYRPPPGFVAVPVAVPAPSYPPPPPPEPAQAPLQRLQPLPPLPPPPQDMPPPIDQWGPPPSIERREG